MKLDGYAYENKQGDMKHYIPEEMDEETPLRLENGNYSLEVTPMFVTSENDKKVAEEATPVESVEVQKGKPISMVKQRRKRLQPYMKQRIIPLSWSMFLLTWV